jgi:biofilm PGA synthesis N-glycosyltransferase PgaC
MLTVLIPAHNEGHKVNSTAPPQITETLESLDNQTVRPDRIIVLADNCTDDTIELAQQGCVEVFETVGNIDKKAGALNQWLNTHLSELTQSDLVMVMDADSALNPDFLDNALGYIAKGYHAVGGVFLGKEGGGFVGTLQRNEYARYARDVARKDGKTLVLTGTATVFTVQCLRDVVDGRTNGDLPLAGDVSQVYDTKALTEDNELTFALLHLGYKIIAPPECGLKTEVMESWQDLWKQRYRWKRGAIENNWHYGFTRYTAKYWGLQIWGMIGILVTVAYLAIVTYAIASDGLHLQIIWMAVTAIFVIERVVTVHMRGLKQMVLAGSLIVEMPYDIWLQACQAWALVSSMFKTNKNW